MSNEETAPPNTPAPREPNTPRTWLKKALAWGEAHPSHLAAFLLGFILGAVIF